MGYGFSGPGLEMIGLGSIVLGFSNLGFRILVMGNGRGTRREERGEGRGRGSRGERKRRAMSEGDMVRGFLGFEGLWFCFLLRGYASDI